MTAISPSSESVVAELRGTVLWVTLSRPEAMNALSHDVLDGIEAALERSLDSEARCVVITGQGRAFCAGADLKFVNSALEDPTALAEFLARASGVFSAVERHPLPVVAAINGTTIAGGLELALACDFIVAVESASIADGHATFGLFPGAGGAVRLPRRIGASRAKLLLFTGHSRSARELEGWGLVDVVAPDDGLGATVQELCDELTRRSPVGLRRMKQVVSDQDSLPVDRGLRMEFDACVAHLRTADVAEGLAAFAEHRAPVFPGG
jgi:enoyl-CoA hydratase/carnithine racemase